MNKQWAKRILPGVLSTTLGAAAFFVHKIVFHYAGDYIDLLFLFDGIAVTACAFGLWTTLRRRAASECALAELEEQFRLLSEAMPQAVWVADSQGQISYSSEKWKKYSGLTVEQVQGWGWASLVHPDDLTRCLEQWAKSIAFSDPFEAEYRFRCASDGAYRWNLVRGIPVCKEGKPVSWIGTLTDIHDQKVAQEQLQLAHDRFRCLVDSNMVGIVIGDVYGRILETNKYFLKMTGYAAEDVTGGLCWLDITPPEYLPAETKALREFRATGTASPYEKQYIRKDGSRVDAIIGFTLLPGYTDTVVGFILDNFKQKEMEKALRAAKEEAEHASHMKDEFFATLSHELRTPLNGIIGWISLIREEYSGESSRITTGIDRIESSAESLARFVEEMFDVSRIVSGKFTLEIGDVDLVSTVQSAVDMMRFGANAKNIQVVFEHSVAESWMRADGRRMLQVVANILNNALKFTERGSIVVSLEHHAEDVLVVVRDTGAGIEPDLLPHVFDRFRQGDSSLTRKYSGLGLGLAIVKHIVELHGGSVWAESAGKGKGSSFFVSLPR